MSIPSDREIPQLEQNALELWRYTAIHRNLLDRYQFRILFDQSEQFLRRNILEKKICTRLDPQSVDMIPVDTESVNQIQAAVRIPAL